MTAFIDERYFNRIKNIIGDDVLTKSRAAWVERKTGASETTQRRIARSRTFADYQEILAQERINQRKNRRAQGSFKWDNPVEREVVVTSNRGGLWFFLGILAGTTIASVAVIVARGW